MKQTKEIWRCELPDVFGRWVCAFFTITGMMAGWFGMTAQGACLVAACGGAFVPQTFTTLEPRETAACEPVWRNNKLSSWGRGDCDPWEVDATNCGPKDGGTTDRIAQAIHEALLDAAHERLKRGGVQMERMPAYVQLGADYKEQMRDVAGAAMRAMTRVRRDIGANYKACVFCGGTIAAGICATCLQCQPDTITAARMTDPTALGRWAAAGVLTRMIDEHLGASEEVRDRVGAATGHVFTTEELETARGLVCGDREAWDRRGWQRPPVTWSWLFMENPVGDGQIQHEILAVRDFAQIVDELETSANCTFGECEGCGEFRALMVSSLHSGMEVCSECSDEAFVKETDRANDVANKLWAQSIETQRARKWAKTWKNAAKTARVKLAKKGERIIHLDWENAHLRRQCIAAERSAMGLPVAVNWPGQTELQTRYERLAEWARRWKAAAKHYKMGYEHAQTILRDKTDVRGEFVGRGAVSVWDEPELAGPQTIPAKPADTWETFPCVECKLPAISCDGECCSVCNHDIGDPGDDDPGPDGWIGPGDMRANVVDAGKKQNECGGRNNEKNGGKNTQIQPKHRSDAPDANVVQGNTGGTHEAHPGGTVEGATVPDRARADGRDLAVDQRVGVRAMAEEAGGYDDDEAVNEARERPVAPTACGARHASGLVCERDTHVGSEWHVAYVGVVWVNERPVKDVPRYRWASKSGALDTWVAVGNVEDWHWRTVNWTPGQYASTVQPSDIAVQEPMFSTTRAQKNETRADSGLSGLLVGDRSDNKWLGDSLLLNAKGESFRRTPDDAARSSQNQSGQNDGCQMVAAGLERSPNQEAYERSLVQWFVQWCRVERQAGVRLAAEVVLVAHKSGNKEKLKEFIHAANGYERWMVNAEGASLKGSERWRRARGSACAWRGMAQLAKNLVGEYVASAVCQTNLVQAATWWALNERESATLDAMEAAFAEAFAAKASAAAELWATICEGNAAKDGAK